MPVTVAAVEAELLSRVGPWLSVAGLDATTADGTNAALRGPIRWAVGRLGLETADAIDVADADLAYISRGTYETLLYLAEYFALESAWGNYTKVDQSLGSESQSLSQRRDALKGRLEWLRRQLGPLVDPAAVPGPPAHGLIEAGRCYPGANRPRMLPWRGGWCQP